MKILIILYDKIRYTIPHIKTVVIVYICVFLILNNDIIKCGSKHFII